MGDLYNQPNQNQFRQQLRNDSTPSENKLWLHLKGKQTGYKFRRQYGIGEYVVDFYCPALRLVIEVDGDSHFGSVAEEYDVRREKYLNSLNMTVLRFTNMEVSLNIEDVLEVIERQIKPVRQTTPNPSLEKEGNRNAPIPTPPLVQGEVGRGPCTSKFKSN